MSDYVSLQTEAPEWFFMPLEKFPNPSLTYKKFQDLHSAYLHGYNSLNMLFVLAKLLECSGSSSKLC